MLSWLPPHLRGNCDLNTVIGKTSDCASITREPFPRGGEPVCLEEEAPCEASCPDNDSCPKVVPLSNLLVNFVFLRCWERGGGVGMGYIQSSIGHGNARTTLPKYQHQ